MFSEQVIPVQRRAAAAIAIANQLGVSVGDLAGGFTGDKVNMPGSDWFMSGNNTKVDCPDPKNWKTEHLVISLVPFWKHNAYFC